ncbi:putative mercuric transport protein [Citrobacter koseri]|uniref:Mercuric transport protein MerT n=1 Tax=Citrobacter koseri TaxID=545 RepID=A0A447UPY5_CITKO|nr:putative mercuric transport protein [Citrobacter koseri]
MSEPQNGRGALFAGGLAAILASACCLGPLVLIALGFSGAWIGNLTVLETLSPDLHRRSAGRAVFRLAAHLPPGASLQTG